MPDLGVAHLAVREADRLAGRLERRVRVLGPEPVEDRRVRELDRVPRPGRGAAPPVEDDERYERDSGQANRRERFHVERGAADERAVDVRLGEQLGRVVRLDRAAVEHRHVEQALDERVRLLGDLGRRGLAGADRPDRLVGDDEVVLGLEHRDLATQDVLGLPRLALGLGLAHAGDHGQARIERRAGTLRDALVGLAEELASLRVADDRAVDPELAQHRRGDLAGERALRLPVHVLRGDRDVRAGQELHGHAE